MTPSEKFINDKSELKENRINRIMAAAFELFSDRGIDTIVMTDIAKKAEIGVASLYRYFETKEEIAIRTAIWAWEQQKSFILPKLQEENFEKLTGAQQIAKICKMFISLYEEKSDFLRFIYFFDSYAVRQKISQERLLDYEKTIYFVQKIVENSIKKGLRDNSINCNFKDQEEVLYFTLMHTLFNTSQKLSLSLNMLKMNSKVSGKRQLELLSELLIKSLIN